MLEDTLSITSSIIKRAVHWVLANLLRRDVKFFSKELTQALLWALHRWTDRCVTYFLELLEPIYNPIFLCVKPQQDLHLHPKSIPTMVITGNSSFLEKKPRYPAGNLLTEAVAGSIAGTSHRFLCLAVPDGLAGLSNFFQAGSSRHI